MSKMERIQAIMEGDYAVIEEKDGPGEYDGAWKKRGGIGAWHQALCRKWDRMEVQVARHGDDLFAAIRADDRPEGILDDIGDLRRYLTLIGAEVMKWGKESRIEGRRDTWVEGDPLPSVQTVEVKVPGYARLGAEELAELAHNQAVALDSYRQEEPYKLLMRAVPYLIHHLTSITPAPGHGITRLRREKILHLRGLLQDIDALEPGNKLPSAPSQDGASLGTEEEV